jgi:chaperonin GroES
MSEYEEEDLKEVKARKLEDLASMDNVAELLDKKELEAIGSKVLAEFELDKKSMSEWLKTAHDCMDLCLMSREVKNTPWQNAANIKHPLIATAVMQFSSRSVAEMSKAGKVAKHKVLGKDRDGVKTRKGSRVVQYMNYQIQEKMPNWFGERDKLHSQLAVCGTSFTKTFYDPVTNTNQSELIPYDQIFINKSVKNLESAPRISQLVYITASELVEQQRYGLFLDKYDPSKMVMDETDPEPIYHELLEQHTYLDLDKDGLPEPYIVVYHIAHKCVLRIAPRFDYLEERTVFLNEKGKVKRIVPTLYYTDYHFIPSPDGSFLSLGFGTLLGDTNHTINTLLNQLTNAGTLATIQGGFIGKDLRIKKEDMDLTPGKWIPVDSASGATIKDSIVPLSYKEPSMVLVQLMDMLVKGANNLTSTSEVLTGTTDVTNASPNSVAMLMQQGLKVYSSIQRRIFRGFKKELEKIVKLNSRYLNEQEYLTLIDPEPRDMQEMYDTYGRISDFVLDSLDIVPIVDIEDSTELEAMNKAQSIMQAGIQFANMGATDPTMLAVQYYKAMEVENIEALVPPPQDQSQQPDPAMIQMQQDMQVRMKELELKEKEFALKVAESEARIKEMNANAVKIMSDAQTAQGKLELDTFKQKFAEMEHRTKTGLELEKLTAGRESVQSKQDIEHRKISALERRPNNPNIS